MSGHHALVSGASGLAGWAVVDELLANYPATGTFERVTALVNRPLRLEDSFWPASSPERPRLSLVDGVNLLEGSEAEFADFLKQHVPNVASVTHVYYFAYKQEDIWEVEVRANTTMLERVVSALELLAPGLQFIAFPSGTRGYGIYVPGGLHKAPLVESMDPLPEPYRSQVFYFAFQELLRKASSGKSWTWAELRPDAIIGFTPHGSTYNLTAHWAAYLSAYARVEGRGASVAFPGTVACYDAQSNDASAAILARTAIWASLHPGRTGGETYNVADSAAPMTMRTRWPALAAYFGLVGAPPDPAATRPGAYVKMHAGRAENWKGEFLDTVGDYLSSNRQLSLDKLRSAGFDEERDPIKSWHMAFDRFSAASIIP
ncbi:hypothetical protein AURDEDRAFT_115013 [Auricularia subglabra TFB-10046 SS5]|nr:hypothetical protein AURDEDRAFT_115013 [Auricularia subglabra TFB-10046 SS5]